MYIPKSDIINLNFMVVDKFFHITAKKSMQIFLILNQDW